MKNTKPIYTAAALSLFTALLMLGDLPAQDMIWERTYGGSRNDGAFAVIQSNDGGIVMAGFSSSFGVNFVEDVYLIKTDASGNAIWNRTIGGNLQEIATDIKQTSDGGYILSGYEQVSNVNDPFLIKTDSLGNVVWKRSYDNGLNLDDRAHSVIQTTDGGYVFAGQTRILDQFPHYDMYVVRTDATGNVIWSRLYGYTTYGNDVAMSVDQLNDGSFVIGGFTQSSIWSSYVLRVNTTGDVLWTRSRPDDYQSECYSVIRTRDGNIALTGTSVSFVTDTDFLIEKLDINGNLLWEKIYGGENAESGQSIKELASGGFVVSGMAAQQSTSWNMNVLQLSNSGDTVWSRQFGGSSDDRGYAVEILNDGNILSAGWVYSFGAGGGDVYLLKLSLQNVSAVNSISGVMPSFKLHQNFPNPFNPATKIMYELTARELVTLRIYNVLGEEVGEIVNEYKSPGVFEIDFDGSSLPGGVYFYRMEAGKNSMTRNMILIK